MSRMFRGSIVITGYCIDKIWDLKVVVIQLKRLFTPHTGDMACKFLYKAIKLWKVDKR